MAQPHPAIKLLVGLGNPGLRYAKTRHNAGKWLIEQFVLKHQIALKPNLAFKAQIGLFQQDNLNTRVLLPETYMNESGFSVCQVAQFYKILDREILVAHDDIDLPAGKIRLKFSGGLGGHNGLKSVCGLLGNSKNFARLRIGVGHPGEKTWVHDHVLSQPTPEEQIEIESAIQAALSYLPDILTGKQWEQAMNTLHRH